MAAGEAEESNVVLGPVARGGFPARSLTSRLPDSSSGEWLLAYQAEQTKYLRAMFASVRNAFQRSLAVSGDGAVSVDIIRKDQKTEPVLDKEFILKHCYVENPTELYVCNISSCGLCKSSPEGFLEFIAVEEVVANDNKLSFEIFAFFPSLQELELSINHIKDVNFEHSQFTNLKVLNLSYNSLSDSALLLLGLLPNLKELHLTGNDIVALPVEMSRALIEAKEDGNNALQLRYTCLEKLWLDDNKLTDLSTFAILAGLRRLKMLNLDNNEIYSIPQLKLLGADNLVQKTSRLSAVDSLEPLIKDQPSTQSITGSNISTNTVDMDELNSMALRGALRPSQVGINQAQFNLAPFPCLEKLSIANNMIMTPEGLLAISGWPSLDTVTIHGNPITRLNKGLPPLLKSELVDPFGIKIVREIPGQPRKPKVAGKASKFVKVSEQPPPVIPKQPLLAIEQSQSSLLGEDSYDSSTTIPQPYMHTYPHTPVDSVVLSDGSSQGRRPSTVGTSERTDVLMQAVVPLEQKPKKRLPLAIAYKADPTASGGVIVTKSPHSDDVLEDSGVFITQVKDDGAPSPKPCPHDESDSPVLSVEEEFKKKLNRVKNKWKNVPDKFKGFEALLESDSEEEDDNLPSDIARCTRALKHALDHPLLLTDCSKPNPSGRQYLRRKSRCDVPKAKALPHKVKEIQQVLHSIKTSCNTLEANLSDVLESTTSKRPPENTNKFKKESKDLLKEIQIKYADVRRNSLINTTELASLLK